MHIQKSVIDGMLNAYSAVTTLVYRRKVTDKTPTSFEKTVPKRYFKNVKTDCIIKC